MELPTENSSNGRPTVRHYELKEYPSGPGARGFVVADKKKHRVENGRQQPEETIELRPSSTADLGAIDLLFCDSLTYEAVKHPRKVMHRLLSDESLREIAAAAKSLVLKATARKKNS
jgi:hypothetical protein